MHTEFNISNMALYQEFIKEQLDRTEFTVELSDAWIDRQGRIIPTQSFCHCKIAANLIYEFDKDREIRIKKLRQRLHDLAGKDYLGETPALQEELTHLENGLTYRQMFENSNKTFGFDEAEYLVAVLGYTAIESHHVIYSSKLINTLQIHSIGCSYEKEGNNKILKAL